MSKQSDAKVIHDEADATRREAKRQARLEKERAIAAATRAAYHSQQAAASAKTAPEAKRTFWQGFKQHLSNLTREN